MVSMKTNEWEKRKQGLNSSTQNNRSKIVMFDIRRLQKLFFFCFCKGIRAILLLLSGLWETEDKQSKGLMGGCPGSHFEHLRDMHGV